MNIGCNFTGRQAHIIQDFNLVSFFKSQLLILDSHWVTLVDVVRTCSHRLINAEFLAQLPQDSHLINISRGGILDESALLAALDSGQLNRATLDVFSVEPLPAGHRLWTHPKVNVTPHMAGPTHRSSAARVVADNILRMERGELPEPLFDRSRGVQP